MFAVNLIFVLFFQRRCEIQECFLPYVYVRNCRGNYILIAKRARIRRHDCPLRHSLHKSGFIARCLHLLYVC